MLPISEEILTTVESLPNNGKQYLVTNSGPMVFVIKVSM
ncbi:hypothetical protein MGWOODY_Mmi367 [hydrothermal vent metagenome]|uniref:Uncharacterized protein n=1 Tax=hydrothermal vent metagenome TaxID=652676 RepID=A0A170QCP1_9ZZZZ